MKLMIYLTNLDFFLVSILTSSVFISYSQIGMIIIHFTKLICTLNLESYYLMKYLHQSINLENGAPIVTMEIHNYC